MKLFWLRLISILELDGTFVDTQICLFVRPGPFVVGKPFFEHTDHYDNHD